MDPLTMAIVSALTNLSQVAIKDSYEGLKSLIIRKFGQQSKVVQAVNDLQANPNSPARQAVVGEEVAAVKAHEDAELLSLAKDLLAKIQAGPAGKNVITQNVKGDHNIIAGSGDIHVDRR